MYYGHVNRHSLAICSIIKKNCAEKEFRKFNYVPQF